MLSHKGNLGYRQRALNGKVNEAVRNNIDFDEIKEENEKSDVDRLFKIDVAIKYKNLDFILQTLQSGDDFYISKALKSTWLYAEDFLHIINPVYLHNNIFPKMSIKIKKKFLTMISVYVKENDRAMEFYSYTFKKLSNIAFKFLMHCSDAFKMDIIRKDVEMIRLKGEVYIINLIGDSFIIAKCYLKAVAEHYRCQELPKLKHLYSISSVKYLDLFEKYASYRNYELVKFGVRISKDIIVNHTHRILANPFLYMDFINMKTLAKYSTREDAEDYLISLLPEHSHFFYEENYYGFCQDILSVIPSDERFPFVKRIFTEKYGEEFETSHDFFYYENHKWLTKSEKEEWALGVIARGRSIGAYEKYYFYKYVGFERAFSDINNILNDIKGSERTSLLGTLVCTVSNQRELEKLLPFYQDICTREAVSDSECVTLIISRNFNVFDFDDACWTVFKNFFQTVEKCNLNSGYWPCYCHRHYEVIMFMHHILNDKYEEIPGDSPIFRFGFYFTTISLFCDKIGQARKDKVYKYIIQNYVQKILALDIEEYSVDIMVEIRCNISVIFNVMRIFGKEKDELPEVVMKHMKLDSDRFKSELSIYEKPIPTELSENILMRFMRKDPESLTEKLPIVKECIQSKGHKMYRLLRKLRIYFADDVAKAYLDIYQEMLQEPKLKLKHAENIVGGILMLASDDFCSKFLQKHTPKDTTINHKCIDRNLFHVQVAICRNVCYSRSSFLQSNVISYIKGDYVKYCTPMLTTYLVNLLSSACIELMQSVVNSRLSNYKYVIRLALQCFTDCMSTKLLLDTWENEKQASIRTFLYNIVYNKIKDEEVGSQINFFQVLKIFTLDLSISDDKEIFDLMVADTLPECVLCEYLQVVWKQVNILSIDKLYRESTLKCIDKHVIKMDKEFVWSIVSDHVNNMFDEGGIFSANDEQNELIEAKWDLTANYIVSISTRSDREYARISSLVKCIFKKCLTMWSYENDGMRTFKDFSLNFIRKLENKSYTHDVLSFKYVDDIFISILKEFEFFLPSAEITKTSFEFKLSTLCRDVLTETKLKLGVQNDNEEEVEAILKSAPLEFAKRLNGDLLQEFAEKGITHIETKDYLVDKLDRIYNYYYNYYNECKFVLNDMYIMTAVGLAQIDSKYSYKIAVLLLRDSYNVGRCEQEYSSVLNVLMELGDTEINRLMIEASLN